MAYELARSLDHVKQYLSTVHPKNQMGMDTEAKSLDTRRAGIAGMSVSLAKGSALYVPFNHRVNPEANLPFEPVWELMEEKMESHTPIFYNAKYDLNILQVQVVKKGLKWKPDFKFNDALELVYLADPDRKKIGLKTVAHEDLGIDMTKFEDLFTPEEIKAGRLDITTKSPERCTDYACADADVGMQMWDHYAYVATENPMAVQIDTLLIDIVRRMEHNGGMELNREYIDNQMAMLETRAATMREQIFRVIGYTFEINSPKQLGDALFERGGLPSPGKTKGKNPIHVTKEEALEKLARANPIVETIIAYKKIVKARSSYFNKLQALSDREIKPRFNFNTFAAPTFRFSAPGGDPDVDGATGVNIQAVSNGEAREVMAVDLKGTPDSADYISQVDDSDILIDLRAGLEPGEAPQAPADWQTVVRSLPYVIPREGDEDEEGREPIVCIRETCVGCPAQCESVNIDTTRRVQKGVLMIPSVRQAFRAPKGYKLLSFDYDRQELVIGANMSGEPRWLRALAKGDDLHSLTAAAAYGIPIDTFHALSKEEKKRKRDVGKVLNFATFYGATAYTLAIKADIPRAAAEQVYDGFVRGHPVLFGWMGKVHVFARKNGYTTTFFGRKRSLKSFYDNPDPKIHAFANRSAVNTAIQGTAAEVTRIAMVKVDKALKLHGYKWRDVAFAMQIHDELAFLVRNELVQEVAPIIKKAMEFEVKTWQVQLTVAPKVGDVWGLQKEIDLAKLAAGEYDKMLLAA